ncbi:MAG: TrkH family potassium uptake protein [Proteobacteria bacterium]|nr:TrkH family potassium uptake protein [Pseudomonadota bacterium]
MNLRPVLLIIGFVLMAVSVAMCVPAAVDGIAGNPDWQAFTFSAGATLFVGVALVLTCRGGDLTLNIRQAFAMITLVWVVVTLFAALPFIFSEFNLSFTDAYFEAMSGITTTGSTVMTGLDRAPPGILLWRGVLQWIGGLGIIVMAISVLPRLGIGGMQMFRIEAFEAQGDITLRAVQISAGITLVFGGLTLIVAIALWAAGMTGLEAAVHAMTTIATGGYSTSDTSIGHFKNPLIEIIITIGMIAGGIPFLLYLKAVQGDFRMLFRDSQVRWYLSILCAAMAGLFLWLSLVGGMDVVQALRSASFTAASIMTGTGYVLSDYSAWGAFPVGLVFFLTFVGGCAGSTSCGMKVFRFQVLYATARNQLKKLLQPHGIFIPYYNNLPISNEVSTSVLSYFFLFGICFALLSLALNMTGLGFVTALSSAATAMANVGPGLGPIVGPMGTFQPLSDPSKWLLAIGMLVGRLEVFAVIILFTRGFWMDR